MTLDRRWSPRRAVLPGASLALLMAFHVWPYGEYLGELVPITGW